MCSKIRQKHRTPLHNLYQSVGCDPDTIETINPIRRSPSFEEQFKTCILSKDDALKHDQEIENNDVAIYSNRSGYRGNIGAAAVMYQNGRETHKLQYYLGSTKEHTVYEGELVGLLLAPIRQ